MEPSPGSLRSPGPRPFLSRTGSPVVYEDSAVREENLGQWDFGSPPSTRGSTLPLCLGQSPGHLGVGTTSQFKQVLETFPFLAFFSFPGTP